MYMYKRAKSVEWLHPLFVVTTPIQTQFDSLMLPLSQTPQIGFVVSKMCDNFGAFVVFGESCLVSMSDCSFLRA